MPEETVVTVERLVVLVNGYTREPGPEPGVDILSLNLTVKNPVGSPGSTRRPPDMELRDETGRVYMGVLGDSLAVPIPPDEKITGEAQFAVAVEAMEFELFLAPGTLDEASITI